MTVRKSITLDDETFQAIEAYRKAQPKIPMFSEAVRDLVNRGLQVESKGGE